MKYRRIAVIGGGIFGITAAVVLGNNGYKVELFEKERDILMRASGINQYRVHRGYHYPRSSDTIQSCLHGIPGFMKMYGSTTDHDHSEHYYCIAKEGSAVTVPECQGVFSDHGLPYDLISPSCVDPMSISGSFLVHEKLYDPVAMKSLCERLLDSADVRCHFNNAVTPLRLTTFDCVVTATYANTNDMLIEHPSSQQEYQYELCEKLILKLPSKYHNHSVVIFDGRFMCIDPFGTTGYHCMGNVVHAVHQTHIGKHFKISGKYIPFVNRGVVQFPPYSNRELFMTSASKFFPEIEESEYIGSMFTVRTVIPYHESDDARPTYVRTITPKLITIFSGKIPTCVDAANMVLRRINDN